jgi:hypothetical protein
VLAARYGTEWLIEIAGAVDPGCDVSVLVTMLDSLAPSSDQEIPVPAATDVSAVREFFRRWSEQLRQWATRGRGARARTPTSPDVMSALPIAGVTVKDALAAFRW